MIVHCEKYQDGYFYCDALHTIGREEDRQLEEELMKLFSAVRAAPVHIAMEYRRQEMDDLYAINAAKTEFRECFNLGDTSRMLAIADPDLVTFSDGQPSEFGKTGLDALKTRLDNLFERFTVKMAVIVIEIRLQGEVAYDYGWHELTLTAKDGGQTIHRRNRYVDVWRKSNEGKWKLWMYIDNQDIDDALPSG
jgi:ketosteroid isomerase-like protein